jgi:hypothetical protein
VTRSEASQMAYDISKLGERQAVTETLLKEQGEKLDKVLASLEALHKGQARADQDRAELARQVATMQPHVETVASWKTFWKIAAWIGATAGSVAAAIWAAWAWLIQYVAWR